MPPNTSISVETADIQWKLDSLVNQPGDVLENILVATYSILNGVQDQVVEDLKTEWPSLSQEAFEKREPVKDLPLPGVEVVESGLRLWYGEAQNPALEFPLISLDKLRILRPKDMGRRIP